MARIGFAGTTAWAAEALRRLAARPELDVAAVLTQPDRPAGRGRKTAATPVARAGEELGVPVLRPEKPAGALEELQAAGIEAMALVAYGSLVPRVLLDAFPWLNLHPSLLPRWRGAAPIERALLAGEEELGVAVILLVQALDAGPGGGARAVPGGARRERRRRLRARARAGPRPAGEGRRRRPPAAMLPTVPQVGEATYAEKLTAADRALDPTRDASGAARPGAGARAAHRGAARPRRRAASSSGATRETGETGLAPGELRADGSAPPARLRRRRPRAGRAAAAGQEGDAGRRLAARPARRPARRRDSVSAARELAFVVVRRALDEGAYADRAFAAEADRAGVPTRERAFAMYLAYGTIQRLRTLDAALTEIAGPPAAAARAPAGQRAPARHVRAPVLGHARPGGGRRGRDPGAPAGRRAGHRAGQRGAPPDRRRRPRLVRGAPGGHRRGGRAAPLAPRLARRAVVRGLRRRARPLAPGRVQRARRGRAAAEPRCAPSRARSRPPWRSPASRSTPTTPPARWCWTARSRRPGRTCSDAAWWWPSRAARSWPARRSRRSRASGSSTCAPRRAARPCSSRRRGASVVAVERNPGRLAPAAGDHRAGPRRRRGGRGGRPRVRPPSRSTPCCWTRRARATASWPVGRTPAGGARRPAWPSWPACRSSSCATPAPSCKPGGRLVYAVCTLSPDENERVRGRCGPRARLRAAHLAGHRPHRRLLRRRRRGMSDVELRPLEDAERPWLEAFLRRALGRRRHAHPRRAARPARRERDRRHAGRRPRRPPHLRRARRRLRDHEHRQPGVRAGRSAPRS